MPLSNRVNGIRGLSNGNIDENARRAARLVNASLSSSGLRDEAALRNPLFALRVDEPRDGAETNVRMPATVSRESRTTRLPRPG